MTTYPISNACPQCGSAHYRKRRISRECRICRTHYRPPTPRWQHWTITIAGLLLCIVSVASILAVGSAPIGHATGEKTDPLTYTCWGVLGAFGIIGLWCVGRGVHELWGRRVVTPPDGGSAAPRIASPPRMISGNRAEALVRASAQQHHEATILRHFDSSPTERPAGPVTLFPSPIYFVVSRRRQCTPAERLTNAIGSFACEWDPEELPLLFLDTSWQRNGRSGILLTNRRLYSSRLDGPIELQDVVRVTFENPSDAEMIFKLFLFVSCFLVGWVFILWGPWFRRRLFVNGEVVYEARANFPGNFWVELLGALGSAARQEEMRPPATNASDTAAPQAITRHVGLLTNSPGKVPAGRSRRQGVASLETHPHSAQGTPLGREFVESPSWEQVEHTIRRLDGYCHPLVCLWAEQPRMAPGLEIIGGAGKYALREVGDGWVFYDPNAADDEVEVQTSGAGHRCAGYCVCTDVERVLKIARRFFESDKVEDDD